MQERKTFFENCTLSQYECISMERFYIWIKYRRISINVWLSENRIFFFEIVSCPYWTYDLFAAQFRFHIKLWLNNFRIYFKMNHEQKRKEKQTARQHANVRRWKMKFQYSQRQNKKTNKIFEERNENKTKQNNLPTYKIRIHTIIYLLNISCLRKKIK